MFHSGGKKKKSDFIIKKYDSGFIFGPLFFFFFFFPCLFADYFANQIFKKYIYIINRFGSLHQKGIQLRKQPNTRRPNHSHISDRRNTHHHHLGTGLGPPRPPSDANTLLHPFLP